MREWSNEIVVQWSRDTFENRPFLENWIRGLLVESVDGNRGALGLSA